MQEIKVLPARERVQEKHTTHRVTCTPRIARTGMSVVIIIHPQDVLAGRNALTHTSAPAAYRRTIPFKVVRKLACRSLNGPDPDLLAPTERGKEEKERKAKEKGRRVDGLAEGGGAEAGEMKRNQNEVHN